VVSARWSVATSVAAPAPHIQTRDYSDGRTHGNLKDADRIFTNLYGKHDVGIKGAMARGGMCVMPPCFPLPQRA
jgi:hypothetical protein